MESAKMKQVKINVRAQTVSLNNSLYWKANNKSSRIKTDSSKNKTDFNNNNFCNISKFIVT